jgi:phage baseplate assembly protein W
MTGPGVGRSSTVGPTALRWAHPDLDAAEPPGLSLSARGRVGVVSGRAAIRQSLLMLLSTVPGERVMRPDYGCDLQRLLFWPNDGTTAGLAIHYVRQAVERFEKRVEVLAVDAAADRDRADQLDVTLAYRIRANRAVESLTFAVGLQDGR